MTVGNLTARLSSTGKPIPQSFRPGANHHLRAKAQGAAQYARVTGKLRPAPEACEDCGTIFPVPVKRLRKWRHPLVAHHEDYAKPLDVNWICRSCHVSRHKTSTRHYPISMHVTKEENVAFREFCKEMSGVTIGDLAHEAFILGLDVIRAQRAAELINAERQKAREGSA